MTTEEKIKQTADDYATNQGGLLTEKTLNAFIAGANFGREIGMKALSVRQPWAYLLCSGIKDIENRTWKLPEKYKGERVLIHASANPDSIKLEIEGQATIKEIEMFSALGKSEDENLFSAIIGSVRFIDCVINHESIWAEKSETGQLDEQTNEFGKPNYNWVATDAVLFEKPILNVKGRLNFWDFDLPEEYVKLINDYDNGKKDL